MKMNNKQYLSWDNCDDEYDFADLWFAVRGGGN
jgi:hypothetical protein